MTDAPAETSPAGTTRTRGLTWRSDDGLRAAISAIPAGLVTAANPAAGVPMALGVLPAGLVAMPGPRRSRIRMLVVGIVCGLAMFLGSALAHLPVPVTAAALFLVVLGAALGTSRAPVGQILLVLAAPLTAVGLSDDWGTAVRTFGLMAGGSALAWLLSLPWPEPAPGAAPSAGPPRLPDRARMLDYGVRLGLAAAIAYLIASALALDHPGWAPGACLLVARPNADLLRTRGVGRVLAVAAGALLGAWLVHVGAPAWLLALVVVAALTGAAGLRTSRWYVTSGFTTLLVFLMLLGEHPEQTVQKFNERVGETLLGVGLAYVFGWLVPMARDALAQRRAPATDA